MATTTKKVSENVVEDVCEKRHHDNKHECKRHSEIEKILSMEKGINVAFKKLNEFDEKLNKFNKNSRERDRENVEKLRKEIESLEIAVGKTFGDLMDSQKNIDVKFKSLSPNATLPKYATEDSAGLDLKCTEIEYDEKTKTYIFHTGWAVEIPKGYVGLLAMKSSVFKKTQRQCDAVGFIDADYRAEILARFEDNAIGCLNESDNGRLFKRFKDTHQSTYQVGDFVVQLVIVPLPKVNIMLAEELSETGRGMKGFGEADEEPIDNEVK